MWICDMLDTIQLELSVPGFLYSQLLRDKYAPQAIESQFLCNYSANVLLFFKGTYVSNGGGWEDCGCTQYRTITPQTQFGLQGPVCSYVST